MGKTAFVFPGQGSQTTGMGQQFYDAWPEFRAAFDRLDDAVPYDLGELVFEGSSERLKQTKYTQPAVLAVGGATVKAIEERYGYEPDIVAGHSLGHFTAHVSAGSFTLESAIELANERGRLMQRAGDEHGPGSMVAALLVDPGTVAEVCDQYANVSVGVYNGPKQTVISGDANQVERVKETLDANHRVRFHELDVGTAFHSPLMRSAVDEFTQVLEETPFDDATTPIVSDVSAEPYVRASVARDELAAQMTNPVLWTNVVERLDGEGVTSYIELPPSKTLTSLIEKMNVHGTTHELSHPQDVEEVLSDVRG